MSEAKPWPLSSTMTRAAGILGCCDRRGGTEVRLDVRDYRNLVDAGRLVMEAGRRLREEAPADDPLSPDLTDVEAEAALTSEGIHVWGPDGDRFQRMFATVMKMRTGHVQGV